MRRSRSLLGVALAAALIAVPLNVTIAQDARPSTSPTPQPATSDPVQYVCLLVSAATPDGIQEAISLGNYEVVPTVDCGRLPPVPGSPEGAVTLTGTGDRNTKPFELLGGDYEITVAWGKSCEDPGKYPTLYNVSLTPMDGWAMESVNESDYVYGLDAGRYYFDVTAYDGPCQWEVTIAPADFG